jgi:hypothetical protein
MLMCVEAAILKQDKTYLLYEFPQARKKIAKLSYDQKMEWYATRSPEEMVFLGNSPEFKAFWKVHVLWPLKARRFWYRLKSGQIFKSYKHISLKHK